MIKKIIILSLTVVFFASITSLPVSLYYCNMEKTYSFHNCAMDMNDGSTMSESEMNINSFHNNGENIQSQNCCSIKVIDSNVKDNYISNISEKVSHTQIITVIVSQNISFDNLLNNDITKNYIDTSPPLLSGNSLYLTNSILLI